LPALSAVQVIVAGIASRQRPGLHAHRLRIRLRLPRPAMIGQGRHEVSPGRCSQGPADNRNTSV